MYYILAIVALLITLIAQLRIKANYKKYLEYKSSTNLSGAEIARKILDSNGLADVKVNMTQGLLSDHYNPSDRSVNLSNDVYSTKTITAAAVAAHECGHAIQHKVKYKPLEFRSALVPLVKFSSYAGYIAIVIGALASWLELIYLGILLECVILLFELVTLPVEFDASRRGLSELNKGYLVKDEVSHAKKVLRSAAFTYVASVANTALQILRLVLIYGNRRRR